MLRWTFSDDIDGALEALPCVWMKFILLFVSRHAATFEPR